MTQSDFGSINPATTSGSQLADKLNNFRDSVYTQHSGNARPSYIKPGMFWLDTTQANPVWKLWDGVADIVMGTFDYGNHKFSQSGDINANFVTSRQISIDGPANEDQALIFKRAGKALFALVSTIAGYFVLGRYNNDGNWVGGIFSVDRNTGVIDVAERPIARKGIDLRDATSLPDFAGDVDHNMFKKGTGDGASYTTYNFIMQGWWGMGMATYDGTINGYYDFRQGIWDVKGGFRVNGNVVPHGGFKASSSEIASGVQNKFPDAAAVKDYMANNVPPSLGIGQSWQDVQANRQAGVAYQNTTGRTIVVSPGGSARNSYCEGQVSADGTNWLTPNRGAQILNSDTAYYYAYPIFEVPPNHYYRLTVGANYLGLVKWLELR